jgi:hypothetical protein
MTIITDFQNGVDEALKFGQKVRIKYYNSSLNSGSYYDDDVILTQSGIDLWISGIVLPITQTRGSNDAVLIEQGKLLSNDSKLYIEGAINTSGAIKIGLGSYTNMSGCEYNVIGEGITKWSVNNISVLKKIYLRRLSNGSLIGE